MFIFAGPVDPDGYIGKSIALIALAFLILISIIVVLIIQANHNRKNRKQLSLAKSYLRAVIIIMIAALLLLVGSGISNKIQETRYTQQQQERDKQYQQCIDKYNPPGTKEGSYNTGPCENILLLPELR